MVRCPACRSPLGLSVTLTGQTVQCSSCDACIDVKSEKAVLPRQPVSAPKHWKIEAPPDSLTVGWPWFSWAVLFVGPAALYLWSLLGRGPRNAEWLVGCAIAVGLTYACLTWFLNSTTVHLNRETLTVRHAPLPWVGCALETRDVQQVLVLEKAGRRGAVTYEVCAVTTTGVRRTLDHFVTEPEAQFLALTLEAALRRLASGATPRAADEQMGEHRDAAVEDQRGAHAEALGRQTRDQAAHRHAATHGEHEEARRLTPSRAG
jgi:hypothetical protein